MIIHNLRLAELRHMEFLLLRHAARKSTCRCDLHSHIALILHSEDTRILIHRRDIRAGEDLIRVSQRRCHMSGNITGLPLRLRVQRNLHGVFIRLDRLIFVSGDHQLFKSTGAAVNSKAECIDICLSIFFHRDRRRPLIPGGFCLADHSVSASCETYRTQNLRDHRLAVLIFRNIDPVIFDFRRKLGSPGETC